MKDSVKRQMLSRQLPRLFALVSRVPLESYASSKASVQKEREIVAQRAYTNSHCVCYTTMLSLDVHPDYEQDGLDVGKLLLKWFIQAAEQEGVPMYASTRSSLALGWVDLCMDTGAEQVDMDEQSPSFVHWTGDAADSEELPKPEEDGTAGVKFMVWKAPEDSVHYREG